MKTKDQIRTEEPRQPLIEPATRSTAVPQTSGWQEAMLHLQRTAGNQATQRAVQRMISAGPASKRAPAGANQENEVSSHGAVVAKPATMAKPQIPTRNAPAVHPAGSQNGAPASIESPGMGGVGEAGDNGSAAPSPGNNNVHSQLPPSLRRFFDSRQDHDLGGARVYQDKPAVGPTANYAPLAVNRPGDRFEREADAVAEYVMRTPAAVFNGSGKSVSSTDNENKLQCQPSERALQVSMQRKCSHCEEEEQKTLQRQKSETAPGLSGLQRKCAQCEEEEEERRRKLQRLDTGAGPGAAPPIVHQVLGALGRPLDGTTRSFMEPRFGHDFSSVRIHADERAAESARSVNALAYTVGRDIVFGAGQYVPNLPAGQKLLAHELTHVVQQGAVPPAMKQETPLPQRKESPAEKTEQSPMMQNEENPPAQKQRAPVLQRQIEGGAVAISALPQPLLQRETSTTGASTTLFTPGSMHNHQPSGRWSDVQHHPNSGWKENWACRTSSPREVVDAAIQWKFGDKPTALRHLRWYLTGHGQDFPENDNLRRFVRTSEHFRRNFAVARHGIKRGFLRVPQEFYGPEDEDFRFSFGAIDRMDFELDEIEGTIHLWFKDRYDFHPVYPFYTHFADDVVRDTNCVHAALVELKAHGAAEFWMIGETTVPWRLFTFSDSDILHEEGAESVRGAVHFLDLMRENLRLDRIRARFEVSAAGGGIADGSRRAHRILNQAAVRRVLQNGQRLYQAQSNVLEWGHPLRGRLRDTYFHFLSEVRQSFDEALAVSRNDQAAEHEEQVAYGESLVLWMEASPMRETVMTGQPAYTAALQSQEADLTAVLTNVVPSLNLAQPGMPARARAAINNAVGRNPSFVTDPARTWATGPVPALADAALAQIDQAEQTMTRGATQLRAALARMDVWLQAPAQPIDVADRVNELFHTRDAGYGQLLRGRMQLMLDNIEGRGQLFAHIHSPGDHSICTTTSTLGQMPHLYEFAFCRFSPDVDSNAATMLHEVAHAVIPGLGTRHPAGAGAPIDRAYSGERLMLRMTTEEALNNAESYAQLVEALAGIPRASIPSDTVTGCADSAPWLDAMALAQSAHRRAWSYLEDAQNSLDAGQAIDPWLRTLIDTHLGPPSDADLRTMLTDFGNLQSEGTLWYIGHTFTCPAARLCPANALAFDNQRIYRSGSVTARRLGGSSNPRICPAFFSIASGDDRAKAAHVIVTLSFGASILRHPEKAWGYAELALAIYRRDIGAAPAASLAEHTAADAAP